MAATIQNKENTGLVLSNHFFYWIPSKDRKLLLIITLVGFFLRVWDLGRPSFWYDEVLTLQRSEELFENSEGLLLRPPGFYFLVWLSIRLFGSSEAIVRFPSVIFGTLTIPLVYALANRLQRDFPTSNQPILAAAFLSGFPLHIVASREAKEYAFLTFLVLLVLILIIEAIYRESYKLVFIGAAVQTLALLTNFLALTIFLPICLFLWLQWPHGGESWRLGQSRAFASVLFALFPATIYASWLLIPREGFHEPTKGLGLSNWFGFGDFYFYLALFLLYLGLGIVFVLLGLIKWPNRRKERLFIIICYGLMLLVLSLYQLKAQRYLVIAIPITMILLAEGFQQFRLLVLTWKPKFQSGKAKAGLSILLISSIMMMPALFISGYVIGGGNAGYHPDWRAACAYVKQNANYETDTFWSTHGTTRIAKYYLGADCEVGDAADLETVLSSLDDQGCLWIIVTKNRFERKLSDSLQEQITTEGSLVWDTRAEDLTTQLLADITSDILSLLGVSTSNWWSLDRMRVYSLRNGQ
ncbi:MAG: glycosyltransferase family 39 protein [Candidatus Thorarchaeota archaeon]